MADAAVSFVLERLGNVLIQEVTFLTGVREQFERLQKELVSIRGFLKTADSKSRDDPDIRIWVADVRDIAYDVDDIIDTFFLKISPKGRSGSGNLFKRCAQTPTKMLNVYKMGKEIEVLFARIEEISNRRQRYGITSMAGSVGETSSLTSNEDRLRRSYPYAKDDNIVGLEEDTNKLVAELMKEGEQRRVVSICGMGGLGKTTLAKRVYSHDSVRNHFDCHAWTFVSQECRAGDVLQEILRQLANEGRLMTEVEMMEKLYRILEEKRYLVVLDDMWREEAWDMLKSAFPNGRNGSKVILTSRSMKVVVHADPWGFHFEPRMLNEDEAWDLICRIASPKGDDGTSWNFSNDLEKCGRNMLKKCGGLPLAIVVLGGILATKRSLNQWETVSKDIGSYMSTGQAGVLAIVALSYNDLPFHLKPLFLFLGLFPEDHHIYIKDVIRMWIAEGLVIMKQGTQVTLEDMGRGYIEELIQRSMIQIGDRTAGGKVRTCQLHDMMRDLSIIKATEENFFQIIRNDNILSGGSSSVSATTSNTKLRRCAIYLEKERYDFSSHLVPCIRTVLFFRGPTFKDCESLNIHYQDFKRVKVLKLQGVRQDVKSPKDQIGFSQVIGKLMNLRYLGLNQSRVKELPESVGNLIYLETLDVRCYGFGMRLPNVIWKMCQLRHLYLDRYTQVIGGHLRLDTLKQLQTLSGYEGKLGIADLAKLSNLQKLQACHLSASMVTTIVDYVVDGLDKLQSLSLSTMGDSTKFPNLERLSQNHRLHKLTLEGKMPSFPSEWPSSLIKLKLDGSYINEDPTPILQNLQNLEHLILDFAFLGKKMIYSKDGFPRLQHLQLIIFPYLEEWIVEKGAMPCLTTLEINRCWKMEMIPEGLKFLLNLQKLHVECMMKLFCARIKKGGDDWPSIEHISSITIQDEQDEAANYGELRM